MKINYCQNKSASYEMISINQTLYIVASRKISSTTSIPIFDNANISKSITFSTNKANRIYLELENADPTTMKDKIAFCNKYGTLINPQSRIPYKHNFRTNTVLYSEATELAAFKEQELPEENIYFDCDYMRDDHFTYYIMTLKLITLLSPYNLELKEYKDCYPLVDFIIRYISKAHAMLFLEYECYEDGFQTFLQAYPFYHFVFTNYDFNDKINDCDYPLFDFLYWCKNESPTLHISDFYTLSKIRDILINVYTDVINFHMKNIPFSLLTPFMNKNHHFYSLGDALIFQKVLDELQGRYPLVCANELCQGLFFPDGHYQIYCSTECGQKVAKRKYKLKKKQEKANKQEDSKMQAPSRISK